MSTQNDLINYQNVIKEANSLINEQIKLWGGVVTAIKKLENNSPSSFVNAQKKVNETLQESVEIQTKLDGVEKKRQATAQQILNTSSAIAKQRNDLRNKEVQNVLDTGAAIAKQKAKEADEDTKATRKKIQNSLDFRAAMEKQKRTEIEAAKKTEIAAQKATQKALEQNRAYNRLQTSWRNAQKALQDSIVTDGLKAKSTQRLQREFNELDKRIKQVDAATKNYSKNVGNYRSAMGGLGTLTSQLSGALGIAGGIYGVVQLGREIYKTTKQLDLINKSMNATAMNAEHLAANMAFLNRVTEESGLRFTDTAIAYNKFYAASKDKLALIEIHLIFDKISKSAALMGMSVHDQNLIFLALEQMMSKGKVSSEELRRQLGERLPGAFDIMARAAGVSTSQLDEMMRKGELISSEILPKFAVEVEKAFGAENIQKVENMAAAENRLSNAWIKFVDGLNSGQGTIAKAVMGVMDFGSEILKAVTYTNRLSNSLKDERMELNALIGEITSSNIENSKRAELIGTLNNKYPDFISFIKDEDYSNKSLVETLKLVNENYRDRIALQIQAEEELELQKERDKVARMAITAENNLYEELHKLNTKYNLGLHITRDNLQETADKLQQVGKNNFSVWETGKVEYYQHTLSRLIPTLDRVNEKYDDLIKKNRDANFTFSEDRRQFLEEKHHNEFLERQKGKADSEIKLTKETEAERKKRLSADKKLLDQEYRLQVARINQMEDGTAKELELLQSWYEYQQELHKDNANELLIIQLDYWSKLKKINDDNLKKQQKDKEEADKIFLAEQDRLFKEDEKNTEEYNKAVAYWDEWRTNKALKEAEEREEIINRAYESVKGFASGVDFGTLGFSSLDFLNDLETISVAWESGLMSMEEKTAFIMKAIQGIMTDVFDAMSERQNAYFEQQFNNLETEKDLALQFAGENTAGREAIEKQYDEKKRALQMEQAKREKRMAIAQATINIASAVLGALATQPVWVGIAMAALVGVLGAVQLATIASTPLPQFYTGTSNAPEGLALTQERGAEMITDKHGNIKTLGNNKGSQLTYLNKGDKVFTADETTQKLNELLISSGVSPIVNVSGGSGLTEEQMRNIMQDTLAKQPKNSITFDENGIKAFTSKENRRTILKNRNVRI